MRDAESVEGKGRKAEQLMRGARKVFMERGYEGASVDEIAKAAGASKATLYSYFPDKRQLFEAVVQAGCRRQSDVVLGRIDAHEPIEVALRRVAQPDPVPAPVRPAAWSPLRAAIAAAAVLTALAGGYVAGERSHNVSAADPPAATRVVQGPATWQQGPAGGVR